MKLSNIGTIKELMGKHGMSFSKSLGQNFLINPSVCPRMADATITSKDTCVIEIGPGIGVLTTELARRAKKVVAIELDKRLIPILNETLSKYDNVKIINDDVLKIDLQKLIENEFNGEEICVCANLPYYISSAVIMKLLEERLPIKCLTLMLQKEMAQRLCAKAGTRQVGAISIAVMYYATAEILFNVSKGSFMPAPKVESSVLKLTLKNDRNYGIKSKTTFFNMVKLTFQNRRKTIVNNISFGFKISKAEVMRMLECINIPTNARAEELSFEQFVLLSNILEEEKYA